MQRIIIQLEQAMLGRLDDAAAEEGLSRSSFVRAAIELALAERRRRAEIADIVRSYRDQPLSEDALAPPSTASDAWPD